MRQIIVAVPRGEGRTVLEMAHAHEGVNLARLDAHDGDDALDLVMVHVSNKKVESLVGQLEKIPNMRLTLLPSAVMALYPPPDSAPDQILEVQERSPIEIFLAGLQSIGSWRGFLAYAAAGGAVVWIVLFTNTVYLLVAAMLIAPFAGPAMNTAIATARGDWRLLWRSVARYVAALATAILTSVVLTLIFRPEIATSLVIDTSKISTVAVLLPLSAGAAGAIHLMQSQQSSLVSGAAVGILIAASLAPPAGMVGMALVIGRYDIALRSAFLLVLQLVGINLSASLVFRSFGLSSTGARYTRGKGWLFPVALGITVALLVALLGWQYSGTPALERSSLEQKATATVQQVIRQQDDISYLDSDIRFTQTSPAGDSELLAVVYVREQPNNPQSTQAIQDSLSKSLQQELSDSLQNIDPLVMVNVLSPKS
jgi:uncharacterized hydrophobic protein (TIGR00271 family)